MSPEQTRIACGKPMATEGCHVACVEESFVLELFVSEPVLSEDEGFQDKKKKTSLTT